QRQVILVVEDDPAVRRVVGDMLASLNYRTAFASDVAEARDVVNARRIDMVLSDVILPGGQSGLDLGAELAMERPNLPVLFVSGYTGNPDHSRDCDCPPDRLLQKPFDRGQLARFLAQALD
ncbi:MAG: response regulator, partial [Pseudomonadota bacterium]